MVYLQHRIDRLVILFLSNDLADSQSNLIRFSDWSHVMLIPMRVDYAVRMLVFLAMQKEGIYTTTSVIAKKPTHTRTFFATNIPRTLCDLA